MSLPLTWLTAELAHELYANATLQKVALLTALRHAETERAVADQKRRQLMEDQLEVGTRIRLS